MSHDDTGIDAYRIGKRRRTGRRSLFGQFKTDMWLRSWQAEWVDCMWAPRAWTEAGVLRKAARWRDSGTDIDRHEQIYGPNPLARMNRGITGGRP